MASQIPQDLVEKLRERRVIPFIGAGFSAALGMPDWDNLLRIITDEVQGAPPYEEIKKCCQGDNLQIAEYLYLKYDKSIGPIRHRLASLLQPTVPLLSSSAHIELVNLNAPQIYTTNYDEAIEQTFHKLHHDFAFVALPKHIAQTDRSRNQVVKYHGDLRYDPTLVLTESSYYSRLEFESPMDLKFRSDLLGRSVLFIGYSFRDINIRIIWFKLMEMMRDVPEADRPSSFVVRMEKNEVLEELYNAVGIRTIYLDPNRRAKKHDDRNKLLESFMVELALATSDDGTMPGANTPMYMSIGFMDTIKDQLQLKRERFSSRFWAQQRTVDGALVRHAASRIIPGELVSNVEDTLKQIALVQPSLAAAWLLNYIAQGYFRQSAAVTTMRLLLRQSSRSKLLESDKIPWKEVWSTKLAADDAESFIKALGEELMHHSMGAVDDDLAYAAALVKQIESGVMTPNKELIGSASEMLERAATVYPAVADLGVTTDNAPNVEDILQQIEDAKPEEERYFGDEPPF